MPTYDYQCEACDHEFEEIQSFSEEPLTKCPQCGKKKLRRLFGTGAGVIFKGSGFNATDSRGAEYYRAEAEERSLHKTEEKNSPAGTVVSTSTRGKKAKSKAAKKRKR